MENSQIEKKKCAFDNDEFQSIENARQFFYNTLKMYKLYKTGLFNDVYCCCDHCYSMSPKWSKQKFYKNTHGIIFCQDCFTDSLNDNEKSQFTLIEFKRKENCLYE